MNEYTKERLRQLVESNEWFKGYRVIIDYAIALACSLSDDPNLCEEMTDYVEDLYAKAEKEQVQTNKQEETK